MASEQPATVFLVVNIDADSWVGSQHVWTRAFRTREAARKAIGEHSDYWADPGKPLEPYWTIEEVPVEGEASGT